MKERGRSGRVCFPKKGGVEVGGKKEKVERKENRQRASSKLTSAQRDESSSELPITLKNGIEKELRRVDARAAKVPEATIRNSSENLEWKNKRGRC